MQTSLERAKTLMVEADTTGHKDLAAHIATLSMGHTLVELADTLNRLLTEIADIRREIELQRR